MVDLYTEDVKVSHIHRKLFSLVYVSRFHIPVLTVAIVLLSSVP